MQGVGVLLVLVYGGAIVTAHWFSDLIRNARSIAGGNSEDAMAAMNRAINIGDALALAVLSDGVVEPRERAELAAILSAHGQSHTDGDALARWQARARELTEPGRLERELVVVAKRLSTEDRAVVLEQVRAMASRGSGVQSVGHFREGLVSNPAALVALYERAFST